LAKQKFHDFLLAAPTSRDEFLARYPHPAILLEPYQDSGAVFDPPTQGKAAKWKISGTMVQSEVEPVAAEELVHQDARVLWLVPPRPEAAATLSVGRTAGRDLVIQHPTISKQHAVFVLRNTGWRISDQGSTNGTFVDGVRLEAGKLAPLQDGTSVRLGVAVTLRYMHADSFWAFCELLRNGSA
jgi:hypothetical protein